MPDFATLLQQGNSWLFVPSAVLLGALHGLEPGHSKTMMAAFIVAIRGTVAQAALLGLSATVSHTAVVWVVALAGLYFGRRWDIATSEPYFQLASAGVIIAVAAWVLWRTWRGQPRLPGPVASITVILMPMLTRTTMTLATIMRIHISTATRVRSSGWYTPSCRTRTSANTPKRLPDALPTAASPPRSWWYSG